MASLVYLYMTRALDPQKYNQNLKTPPHPPNTQKGRSRCATYLFTVPCSPARTMGIFPSFKLKGGRSNVALQQTEKPDDVIADDFVFRPRGASMFTAACNDANLLTATRAPTENHSLSFQQDTATLPMPLTVGFVGVAVVSISVRAAVVSLWGLGLLSLSGVPPSVAVPIVILAAFGHLVSVLRAVQSSYEHGLSLCTIEGALATAGGLAALLLGGTACFISLVVICTVQHAPRAVVANSLQYAYLGAFALLSTVIVALQLTTTSWLTLFWWPDVLLDSCMAGDARAPWTVLLLADWVAMLIVANLLVLRSVARVQFFDKSDGSYVGRSLLCDASSCIPARFDLPLRLAIINGLAFPTPYLGLSLFLLLEARSLADMPLEIEPIAWVQVCTRSARPYRAGEPMRRGFAHQDAFGRAVQL